MLALRRRQPTRTRLEVTVAIGFETTPTQCYVSGNPSFGSVVEDPATADFLRTRVSGEGLAFRTKEEAEAELGEFFGKHLSEWHLARNVQGDMTYNYVLEVLRNADLEQPQCTDLYTLLTPVLAGDEAGVSLQPLHQFPELRLPSLKLALAQVSCNQLGRSFHARLEKLRSSSPWPSVLMRGSR